MNEAGAEKTNADRRTFLKWSIFGLLSAFFAGAANVVVRYLMPPPPAHLTTGLSIPVAQIPPGSSMVVKYKGSPVVLVNTGERVVAFDAACTHLGCIVKWMPAEKILYCPCHAGKFDSSGKVVGGPPPEPLQAVPVEVREEMIRFV